MSKPEDHPDPPEEPEPQPPEDFAARRLKEFLEGRFPGQPLPPGLPEENQLEGSLPEEEPKQDESKDEKKESKEGSKREPRKPKKPKRN